MRLHNFHPEEFKLRIKNFNVNIKSSSFRIIADEILYLLGIYESEITNLMFDLNNLKKDPNFIKTFNNIRNEMFINKKLEFSKFRIDLKEKVEDAKFIKISEKQNKNVLRKKTVYFPNINLIKLRRNKSQENIKGKTTNSKINNFNIYHSSIYF